MIRALDPRTVETKWEYPLQAKTQSGLVSTASDLVFGGSVDGYFYALDATGGEELWRMNVGGTVKAASMTYMAGGKQYVTIAAGNAFVTWLGVAAGGAMFRALVQFRPHGRRVVAQGWDDRHRIGNL